ncbi:hypothetical protein AX14_009974 [Amanita brunnescens Koide BX004]|nr:hypothetical protein AX14_009974 [Amanita brunnescens Koide BX004]
MPDDQPLTPYDRSVCMPRGGPAVTPAVAHTWYSPALAATAPSRSAIATRQSSPAANALPGCPMVRVSDIARAFRSSPVTNVTHPGHPIAIAVMRLLGVAFAPSVWPLPLPFRAPSLRPPPWLDDSWPLPDDEVFRLPRDRSPLTPAAAHTATAVPGSHPCSITSDLHLGPTSLTPPRYRCPSFRQAPLTAL